MTVTRQEILDVVGEAFDDGRIERSTLLAAAVRGGARPEVITTLEQLPDKPFGDVRHLWVELPDVPVEA